MAKEQFSEYKMKIAPSNRIKIDATNEIVLKLY